MDVLTLIDERATNRMLTGGKAAQLSLLLRAGFQVPSGFVVTTEAWKQYVQMDASLSNECIEHIHSACEALAASSFAVRSSAVVEDGNQRAWAGQFSTFLDVSIEEVHERVIACFASARSARARAYGERQSIRAELVPMAALVQPMIPAEVAGVGFTMDPVSKDRTRVLIESVQGNGMPLVDGTVTPDTYVLDKETGRVLERHGGALHQPHLSAAQLQMVFENVCALESHSRTPQDVEWALVGGTCWILQSRPITTL